jgi:hypothetical protein
MFPAVPWPEASHDAADIDTPPGPINGEALMPRLLAGPVTTI